MSVLRALSAAQKEAGLTQAELASAAGVGRPAMNAYLSGRRDMPLPVLVAAARKCGLTLFELAERAEAIRRRREP